MPLGDVALATALYDLGVNTGDGDSSYDRQRLEDMKTKGLMNEQDKAFIRNILKAATVEDRCQLCDFCRPESA